MEDKEYLLRIKNYLAFIPVLWEMWIIRRSYPTRFCKCGHKEKEHLLNGTNCLIKKCFCQVFSFKNNLTNEF